MSPNLTNAKHTLLIYPEKQWQHFKVINKERSIIINGAASFEGDKCVCVAVYRKITPLVM